MSTLLSSRALPLAVIALVCSATAAVRVAPETQTPTTAGPLRIFIRSGPKSHGPGAHDYPRFLKEWVPMLNARGARATGAEAFPTKPQLDDTDVLILHKQEAGNIDPAERVLLNEFLARGGGVVVIHAGTVSRDPDWFRTVVGGSWRNGTTRWLEGPMQLYFTDRESPITKGASNWEMDDEIYYDMDILPEARILAAAYTPKSAGARNAAFQRRADELTGGGKRVGIYDIQPQMWTYENTAEGSRTPYRAFVSIPGHLYENFNRVNYRTILLRGIAWAGRRANVDELVKKEELGDALRYVDGGPTSPMKAAAALEVHPEFDVSLVAAEPLIAKAMNLDWDERGRLWVSETPEYPNGLKVPNTEAWKDSGSLAPRRQARDPEDTISILTDTNGDGVMDRKHVFADKLELVTGFVFYRNGVIAATSPDIWYLEDTNGDEVADKRTKLYTGLGTYDTHAVINNLRWGLDGWIYATHGYSVGAVTSPDGSKSFGRDSSGVVRFKPDGSAFEQYSSRGGNTWGLDITWDGQVFWTQPTSGTVFFHTLLPESVLAKGKLGNTTSWKGMIAGQKTYPRMLRQEQAYAQIDLVGQFTAAAGCAIYDGGAWPDRWRYSYFTAEPTLNIVHHEFVKPDGVSYATMKEPGREETEFIRSSDMWFRPIETRVGPDGALYVIDFYNQAVIHNDTRGPLHGPANAAVRPDRDHYFGRIWRVQHKQAKRLPTPALNRKDLPLLLRTMETSPNAHVKLTAWRLAQENYAGDPRLAKVSRPMGSKVLALYERSRGASTAAARRDVLDAYVKASDDWTRSALIAAATEHAADFVADAFAHPQPQPLVDFVAAVVPAGLPANAERVLVASASASSPELKAAAVRAVARMAGAPPALAKMSAAATQALGRLLDDPAAGPFALAVAAKWDKSGALSARAETRGAALLRELADAALGDDRRVDLAASLLAVPSLRAGTLKTIAPMLADPAVPSVLKTRLSATLGEHPGSDVDAVLVSAAARNNSSSLFDQIVRRPETTNALLAALKAGTVTPAQLGPGNVARLRTHPNRQVARQAAALLDTLSPALRRKDDAIAALTPEIEKAGDAANGRKLFTAACSTCHRFSDVGKSDVGPPLTGMGAHGRAALLSAIIDPNREVDPSFWQWNITTKKGETLTGIIAGENASAIVLRGPGGDRDVSKEEIATRENTRLSLMPEGLEALGADALRDILTFLEGDERTFRVVDLREAYTADSRRGLRREDERDETVALHRFGDVSVAGVPFFVMDPARSPSGLNIVALKGGPGTAGLSEELPRRIEIPVSSTAASLHVLGAVGGWAWPAGGDQARGLPVMKITVQYADGSSEEHILKNGEHVGDTFGRTPVPLSVDAGDFTRRGQLRYLALNLGKKAPLSKLVLESYDTDVVPCTVAITLSSEPATRIPPSLPGAAAGNVGQTPAAGPKEGGKGDAPLPETKPITWTPGKAKVLIIGGGSSHDFGRFFGGTDRATLAAAGFSVNYTEDRDQAASELGNVDVAVISVNRQFFDTPAYRKALFDFAAAGKGLVMLHPGVWYGFADWPELNAAIVGGGARGHDRPGKFSVNVLKADHPVMKGVPQSFDVEDELYYVNAEPEKMPPGTAPIEVLAETSPSIRFKKPHPSVWTTGHPTARIVGIALGHDERVHDHAAFKTLLVNAATWVTPTNR